jgi:parvulin-like peptidyl-prolyl isomerase
MNRLRLMAIPAALIFYIIAAPLHAQRLLDEIIARVGNDIILKSEYESARKNLRDELTQQGLTGAQLEQVFQQQSKDLLRNLIDDSLLVQQAKEMGITGDLEVIKQEERMRQEHNRSNPKEPINSIEDLERAISQQMSLDEFKMRIKTRYLRDQVLGREVYGRVIVTNEEMRTYYEAHKKDFDRPEGVHIREISVSTQGMGAEEAETQRKKLEDALAAIKKGSDFGEIAQKYSESDTAQSGGDLGFFEKGQLAKDVEELISKLDKGAVTDVIKTSSGFMILQLQDRHPGGVLPFESAQNEISGGLFNQKALPKIREYLTKLRTEGFVWIKEGYADTGAAANSKD